MSDSITVANAFAAHFTRFTHNSYIPLDFNVNECWDLRSSFTLPELQSSLGRSSHRNPSIDGITLRLVQCLNRTGQLKLFGCLNRMWTAGHVPSAWRVSTVVPIPKPGKDLTLITAYQPIALTSVLAKVFERMILQRLTSWLFKRDIFHPNHFGFLTFRDCDSVLMKIYLDLLSA